MEPRQCHISKARVLVSVQVILDNVVVGCNVVMELT